MTAGFDDASPGFSNLITSDSHLVALSGMGSNKKEADTMNKGLAALITGGQSAQV